MEIKDVNKLTNMFLNQSSNSASSAEGALQSIVNPQKNSSIKEEFMAMLQQTSGGISFSSLQEEDYNTFTSPITRKYEKNLSDKSDADMFKNEEVSKNKNTYRDNVSDKKTSRETSQQDDISADRNKDELAQRNNTVADSAKETPAEQDISSDSSEETSVEEDTKAKIDELLGLLSLLGVNVSDLNGLNGEITIVNGTTNESMTINATDLLSALNSQTDIMVPLANTDSQVDADVVLMPLAEVSKSLQDSGVDISSLEPVLNKFSVVLKNQSSTDNVSEIITDADSDITLQTIQGEALSKKVNSDKKVEVSVKVQEENFSYKKAEDSISTPLNNIISDKSTSQKAQPQTTLTPTANSAAQLQGGMAANTQVMTGMVNTASADKMAEAQLSGIKDIANGSNSNTLQHAGSEAAQLAKTEQTLASETKNSTIRDVYKGMSKDAIEQIKVNITKSAVKGVDKIEIQLKPEDLGHIEIKMQISKDGKLQAHIISSRAETMDMLQKDMSSLEKAFNDAGFNTDEGSFSFSFREKNNEQNNQEALRNFLGEILEQDTANSDILTDMASGEHWDGKSALNIRV